MLKKNKQRFFWQQNLTIREFFWTNSCFFLPCSPVDLHLLSVPEVGERGVSLDLVALADAAGAGAVKLGDLGGLGVGELGGELIPDGGEFLKNVVV